MKHRHQESATREWGLFLLGCERQDLDELLLSKRGELSELAEYGFRAEVGAIGYRSHQTSDEGQEWVRVDWGESQVIDQITIVPSIRRDSRGGLMADGFPEQFRVVVGRGEGELVVFDRSLEAEVFLPRVSPYVIRLEKAVEANWVRVEALELSETSWDASYYFSLSELMVFSGERNVALQGEVTASTSTDLADLDDSRDRRYLVDGHLPYRMDSASGEKSISYISVNDVGAVHRYEVDLGAAYEVDFLRLHRVEIEDTIPQSEAGDFALPDRIRVWGSLDKESDDELLLLERDQEASIYKIGPMMSFNLKEERVRYLRFEFESDCIERHGKRVSSVVGFSEIELFSQGRNVLAGKRFQAGVKKGMARKVESLTDGLNYYGEILPERQWVEGLAKRHELEKEIPQIEEEVIRSYARQKKVYVAGGVILFFGLGLSAFLAWLLPRRERLKFRERMAADMHDELGANLHTISFISDGLKDESLSREEVLDIQKRIRHVAERTGRAVYHMSGVLEDESLYRGLLDDMERAAERVLTSYDHEFRVIGEELLDQLPKKLQVDLLLFYQECLVNIGRHSDAEKFETLLKVEETKLTLAVRDFGTSSSSQEAEREEVSPVFPVSNSLQRRAKLLRGRMELSYPENGGVKVILNKRLRLK